MKHESKMEFDQDFETGGILPHPAGVLYLGDEGVESVRLFIFPDGLHILVPKGSKFVHETDRTSAYIGFGDMGKLEK